VNPETMQLLAELQQQEGADNDDAIFPTTNKKIV
jgi:hypothetical protein